MRIKHLLVLVLSAGAIAATSSGVAEAREYGRRQGCYTQQICHKVLKRHVSQPHPLYPTPVMEMREETVCEPRVTCPKRPHFPKAAPPVYPRPYYPEFAERGNFSGKKAYPQGHQPQQPRGNFYGNKSSFHHNLPPMRLTPPGLR